MGEMQHQPGADPAGAPGPGGGRALLQIRGAARRPTASSSTAAEQQHRVWAIRTRPRSPRSTTALADGRGTDRRRAPPVRRLPAAAGVEPRHRVGPRSGDARRPGRHPAVPRTRSIAPSAASPSPTSRLPPSVPAVPCAREPASRHSLTSHPGRWSLTDCRDAGPWSHRRQVPASSWSSGCTEPLVPALADGARRRSAFHHTADEALGQSRVEHGARCCCRRRTSSGCWDRASDAAACCPRRRRRSSRSRAWASSCARCATNDPRRADLDLHPGPATGRGGEEPAPHGSLDLHHVSLAPRACRAARSSVPCRALECVHTLLRLVSWRSVDHHPEAREHAPARQGPLLSLRAQATHETHLFTGSTADCADIAHHLQAARCLPPPTTGQPRPQHCG